MINRVVLCTGGFDPLHSGHIEYLKAAKAFGNILIVGVNACPNNTCTNVSPFTLYSTTPDSILELVVANKNTNPFDGVVLNEIEDVAPELIVT